VRLALEESCSETSFHIYYTAPYIFYVAARIVITSRSAIYY